MGISDRIYRGESNYDNWRPHYAFADLDDDNVVLGYEFTFTINDTGRYKSYDPNDLGAAEYEMLQDRKQLMA